MVVVAIISILASVGFVGYSDYIYESKVATLKNQHEAIHRKVDLQVELRNSGIQSTIRHHTANSYLLPEDTCLDMVPSIKAHFSDFKNVFDDSEAITLWPGTRRQQKKGKINIRCYKYQDWDATPAPKTYNGGACPANKAGFRVSTFLVDCGNDCEKPTCQIAKKECAATGNRVETNRTSKLVYTNQELNIKFGKGNLVSAVASA